MSAALGESRLSVPSAKVCASKGVLDGWEEVLRLWEWADAGVFIAAIGDL